MPKFRIHTDKGDFIIETENPADTPAGQAENAQVTEEERRWKSLGIVPDDAGRVNGAEGPNWQQQLMYDLRYPSPGKKLAGDLAATATTYIGSRGTNIGSSDSSPRTMTTGPKGDLPRSPVGIKPSALLDFKVTQPLKVLKDFFYLRGPEGVSIPKSAFGNDTTPGPVGEAGAPSSGSYFDLGTKPPIPTPRSPQTFRVPYGAVNPPPSTAGPMNIPHGFPSSLEDALTQAVDVVRAGGVADPKKLGSWSAPGEAGPISASPTAAAPTPGTPTMSGSPFSLEEAAQALRRYYGSDEATRQAFLKNTPANKAHILELAGGPSRVPLSVEEKTLDELFKQMVDKDK